MPVCTTVYPSFFVLTKSASYIRSAARNPVQAREFGLKHRGLCAGQFPSVPLESQPSGSFHATQVLIKTNFWSVLDGRLGRLDLYHSEQSFHTKVENHSLFKGRGSIPLRCMAPYRGVNVSVRGAHLLQYW